MSILPDGVPEQIPSPYGFVPLSEQVVQPDWAAQTTQDLPFSDGHSGWLDLTLRAETPVCVRNGGQSPRETATPYKVGERFAIPGSTVRGLLRNTVEIAAFGKMNAVDDRRYGVRDLTRNGEHVYRKHMARIIDVPVAGRGSYGRARTQKTPVPLVQAGWLRRTADITADTQATDVVAQIEPVHWGKYHYKDLLQLARATGTVGFEPGRKQSAPRKYRAWQKTADQPLRVFRFATQPIRAKNVHGPTEFCKVTGPGPRRGTVVLTGQPNNWSPQETVKRKGAGNPKQHDFVFFEAAGPAVDVTFAQLQDFELVHSDRGQQDSLGRAADPNEEWSFWRPHFNGNKKVPVFFLLDTDDRGQVKRSQTVRAFGLAMMFKLAYRHTTRDAVKNVQKDVFDGGSHAAPDLAELMFGFVREQRETDGDAQQALRGRIQVGTAFAEPGMARLGQKVGPVVLSSPRASYLPNYVRQAGHGEPQTYMDKGVQARGWKRYRPQTPYTPPKPKRGDGRELDLSNTGTTFVPIDRGAVFRCRVRVHNLRLEELGALVWAATFGGDPTARHVAGLARPLGYGRLRVQVAGAKLRQNRDFETVLGVEHLEKAMAAFVDWMTRSLGRDWRNTRQIKSLLALARPLPAGDESGHYPQLQRQAFVNGRRRQVNDFQAFKQAGMSLPETLGPAAGPPRVPVDASPPPRPHWAARATGRLAPTTTTATTPTQAASPTAATTSRKPFPKMARGTVVKVRLTGTDRSGKKWRGELVDYAGTVTMGGPKSSSPKVGDVVEGTYQKGQGDSIKVRWA